MGIVCIGDLKPDMVLKKPVQDLSGRMLLGRGEKITAKHLRIFKAWGVTEADVAEGSLPEEVVPAQPKAGANPVLWEKAVALTTSLFAHNNLEHPFVQEVFQLSVKRRYQQLEKGGQKA